MRGWWLAIAGVLVLAAAIAWRVRAPEQPVEKSPERAWPVGFGGPPPTERTSPDVAPQRLRGWVVDGEGAPVPSAVVRLYARPFAVDEAVCDECGAPAWSCPVPSSTRRMVEALRADAFPSPPVLEERAVEADGSFVFEQAPPGAVVWAGAEGRVGTFSERGVHEPLLRLYPVGDVELTLIGDDGPRTDGVVTLFEPLAKTARQLRPDDAGRVVLRSADALAWVYAEAPGAVPWGERLSGERVVFLSAPRTLVVKTVHDGAPVDADVELESFRHHFKQRAVRGEARFEGLAPRPVNLTATAGPLASGRQRAQLDELETVVVVELFEAGSLTVSLESPEGEPLDDGYLALNSMMLDVSQQVKPGALASFERLPAGDYQLVVETRAFVREERKLEIVGGRETRLSLTLRRPLIISGSVIDAQGAEVDPVQITVTDEHGEEVDTRPRAYGVKFEQEVPYAGTFIVHAASLQLGAGEARATVPGPPVVVQLKPRGVLEARVLTPDGEDLSTSASLVAADGWRRLYLDSPLDGGWARNASLAGGEYQLRGDPLGYLPFERTVKITEGKTTRVELTLDPGATISGRVLQHDGKPMAEARVSTNGSAGYVSTITHDDGAFELRGVPPGANELVSCDTGTMPEKTFTIEVPARGVELRCPEPRRAHGRVVSGGTPVKRFRANDRDVSAPDGRFDIPWTGRLMIYAEGYAMFALDDAGVELGDLELEPLLTLEGDVLGADGAAVSGASVHVGSRLSGVRSDARGHFKLTVYQHDEVEVLASLGNLSGRARATAGTPVRIVLKPNARVTGHIADRQGRGVSAAVSAEGNAGRMEFRSDAQGNFSGELAPGVWIFNSRAIDGIRVVEISAPETRVELGRSASSCGLTVQAPGRLPSVAWLLPTKPVSLDVEPEPVANAVSAAGRGDSVVFAGVPCGAYSVVVAFSKPSARPGTLEYLDSIKPTYASELITLRGNDERLVLPAP